jgi:dTMP kinase
VRELVLHGDEMTPWAEAALFAAARAQLVAQEIRPALERGEDVVLDRYLDSSVAYQGFGRSLGEEAVRNLSLTVTGGLLPHRTFLLEIGADTARSRSQARPDRIEREDGSFVERVGDGYRRIAEAEPGRFVALDGTRDPETIAEEVREHVRALL